MKLIRPTRRLVLSGAIAAPFVLKARAQDFVVISGQTLTILVDYGPHWSSAPAALQAGVTASLNFYAANTYVNTTIKKSIDYGYCNGQQLASNELALTQQQNQQFLSGEYSTIRAAMAANARTANARNALAANWPSSDPTGGAEFVLNAEHMRVLGLWGPWPDNAGGIPDTYHGFGSGDTWFYGTPVANAYDAFGTPFHEFTEGGPRYKANFSPGQLQTCLGMSCFVSAGTVQTGIFYNTQGYYSQDNGATVLQNFPYTGGSFTSEDSMDWRSNGGDPIDSFMSIAVSGQTMPVSTVDANLLDALGWSAAP